MADFCRPYPDRLYNVAPVPLVDVEEAIKEMRRLEKYPRLRVAFLETGGGWLSYWLARLDEFHEKIGRMLPPLKLKPSEYFSRQCFLSCEPDDVALKTAVTLGTENVLMWASDYPHFDCTFPGVVDELREGCEGLPESAQRKIMGENAARCYGLA